MKRLIFILLLSFSLVRTMAVDVKLSAICPDTIIPGSKFKMVINIDKPMLMRNYARFEQLVPSSFTISDAYSQDAEFSFDAATNTLNFIWFRLPEGSKVKVEYTVTVSNKASGRCLIGGTFSYLNDNQRLTQKLADRLLTIAKTGGYFDNRNNNSANPVTEKKNEGKKSGKTDKKAGTIVEHKMNLTDTESKAKTATSPVCYRNKPYYTDKDEYMVILTVRNGKIDSKVAIEEEIPKDFTAKVIENESAVFTTQGNKVKFEWKFLPKDNFIVAYSLTTTLQKTKAPAISGTFRHGEEKNAKTAKITEKEVDKKLITNQTVLASFPKAKTEAKKSEPSQTTKKESKKPSTKTKKDSKETSQLKTQKDSKLTKPLKEVAHSGKGVYYSVQVACGHKILKESYFSRLNLKEKIFTDRHQGWRKYSVGSFANYSEARKLRNKLRTSSSFSDAFVAAYKNSDRISMKNALAAKK